jgi:hypothetical protein
MPCSQPVQQWERGFALNPSFFHGLKRRVCDNNDPGPNRIVCQGWGNIGSCQVADRFEAIPEVNQRLKPSLNLKRFFRGDVPGMAFL